MSKSIIVLGMHKSRTSLVAKILMELGVFMGHAFRKPDSSNPYGYWEDIVWRNINKTLLNASGHTWWDPPPIGYNIVPMLHTDVSTVAKALADHRSTCYPIWGFKDPRTILTATYLHHTHIFPDPHYVVVTRPTLHTVLSLCTRANARGYSRPMKEWRQLCETYDAHLKAFLASGNNLKVYMIHTNEILVNGHMQGIPKNEELMHSEIRSLAEFVGVQAPDDIQAFMNKVSGNKLI